MSFTAGTRVGPYEILASVGAGGMGEVYRARDTKLNRDVAIKVLPEPFAADVERVARFEREALILAALNHPSIVPIHDFGTHDGVTYAVMPLLEGETLRERLARGAIPARRTIEYGAAIASGLAAAHEKRIVHRDLKPDNVFVTADGHIMLLDFGLARSTAAVAAGTDASTTLHSPTMSGTVLGTVGYMAPEQVRGEESDARTDIFALGTVLYEMATGRRAFDEPSAVETMNAIVRAEPVWRATDDCPPALQHLIDRCLEKAPAARFQSASDLAFALRQMSSAPSTGSAPSLPLTAGRSTRRLLWTTAALAVALAAFAIGRWIAPDRARETFRFDRLTFRAGNILQARFTPDGSSVVYGASWGGAAPGVFTVRATGGESRPLDLENADVAALSANAELAIIRSPSHAPGGRGILARVPLGGGAPRDVLDGVFAADWDPKGSELAVVRRAPNGVQQLEYPIDHVLYQSQSIRSMRLSPDGRRFAFVAEGQVVVIDASTGKEILRRDWGPVGRVTGVAWAPSGDALYVVGGPGEGQSALRKIDFDGGEQVLVESAGVILLLHDVARNGDILVERATSRGGILYRGPADDHERDLSWLDGSRLRAISDDGARIVFSETLQGAGARGDVYLRNTDGSLPVRLGDGDPLDLSRDGKWVLAITRSTPKRLVLLPTGPGVPRSVDTGAVVPNGGAILPDGTGVVFGSEAAQGQIEFHLFDLRSGTVRPVTVSDGATASVFVRDRAAIFGEPNAGIARILPDGHVQIRTLAGSRRIIPGAPLSADENLIAWGKDGFLYTVIANTLPARLFRIDARTGARTPWRTLMPADPAGVTEIAPVLVARDGRSYAYSYSRVTSSDLFIVRATSDK